MIAYETGVGSVIGTFPNTAAKNSSSAGATDGTPLVAEVYNEIWGFTQVALNLAGLTPNGLTDSITNSSQLLQALQALTGPPGTYVLIAVADPASIGLRAIIPVGQTLTIANYADLVAATYIGDGNNSNTAYQYFYKCSDAGGSTRATAGPYFRLPDLRGTFLRVLDAGASRNPNGNVDFIGNYRGDAIGPHTHTIPNYQAAGNSSTIAGGSGSAGPGGSTGAVATGSSDTETRSKQTILQIALRY